MEEKHNQATPQRPAGARPLDAAIIPIDMPNYIEQLKKEDAYHRNGKNAITVFKSEKITITLIALKANEKVHPGNEEQEAIMSLQLISGALHFESKGEKIVLNTGHLLTLHQQLSFNAIAIADSICLLTMIK